MLAVQNHNGTWSAPKGHLEIKEQPENELTIESYVEVAFRELLEEVNMKFISAHREKVITKENIGQYLSLQTSKLLRCELPDKNKPGKSRYIHLFVVDIDKENWQFTLNDKKENQVLKNLCIKKS